MHIGIDIGTSSTKAVVIDRNGSVVASASAAYDFDRPRDGWSEQDPRVWWTAAREVLRRLCARVDAGQIEGIGLSGQMHGCVLIDERGLADAGRAEIGALRPALMWNDQRTEAECAEIESAVGGRHRLVQVAGNAALTGFTLPKMLWVRRHEPEVWERARAVMMPKDFVRLCLSGEAGTDVGDASGVLLLDVERRAWSEELCEAVGVDRALLPRVHESGAVAGRVTDWAAAETGLRAGTPIVAGSGDNQCGGIGAGAVVPGVVVLTLGTSGVVFAHSDRCVRDIGGEQAGRLHTMCSATGNAKRSGAWTMTGCMLSAAGSLEWARGVLGGGASFDELLAEAARVEAGCGGLMFLPHLTGERCPHADPSARGAWVGLTRRHGRGHLVRSVLEGVSLTLGQIFEIFESVGVQAREVRLGGGGAKSGLWSQMMADVLGRNVCTLEVDEGPAHGAALIAAASTGGMGTLEAACARAVRVSGESKPGAEAAVFAGLREKYAGLYPALRRVW